MADLAPRRLLLVQFSSELDGAGFSGLAVLNGLREAGWQTSAVFASQGPMLDRYRDQGHECRVIGHKCWLRRAGSLHFARDLFSELRRALEIRALIRRIKPDLVYINTLSSLAGALAARLASVPAVWHLREQFDDVGGEMRSPRWARQLVPWTLARLSRLVVANSNAVLENVLGEAGHRKGRVIYNAVDARFLDESRSRDEARRIFGLPPAAAVVGIPGTLRPMKGHAHAFRALAPLIHAGSVDAVLVSGDGNPGHRERLDRELARLGITGSVHFTGSIRDMPAFFRAIDVACVPSRSEPFGRVIIEAQAVGCPVVASAVGGIIEATDQGETALLSPPEDEELLREHVRRSLDGGDDVSLRVARARLRVETVFDASRYVQAVKAAVADALSEAGDARV